MKTFALKIILIILLLLPGCSGAAKKSGLSTAEHSNKPVVMMLHGWGRNPSAMWYIGKQMEKSGFDVVRLEYHSLTQGPDEIMTDITGQINTFCTDHPKRQIHFVGHSMGGLVIRAFLEKNNIPNLGRVVLMGTPNQGVPIVDRYRDTWWMKALGPSAATLGTNSDSFPASIGPPDYPIGIIAGHTDSTFNDRLIPGRDDGLVPVESTLLPGMTDFIVINSGHWTMRYDKEIARQVILFLNSGRFDHD